ncbi:MAG: GNAT family N-acetyltransferase [Planctomycetota bacterium]
MIFETERLHVRKLRSSDFDDFHQMQSNLEVMRYTSGIAYTADQNRDQLEDCIRKYSDPNNEFWVWAIIRKRDQQFVGTCAIVPSQQGPEIGYRFLENWFGNGYGHEICDGLILYAIESLGLTKIVAYVDEQNLASVKILDKSQLEFLREEVNETGGKDRFYCWSK